MTTPSGHLPDWQTLTTPQVVGKSAIGQPAGTPAGIVFSSPNPFRVWGAWISAAVATDAIYNEGLNGISCELQDNAGNDILAVHLVTSQPNQIGYSNSSISCPGITPQKNAGVYQVQINISPGNVDTNAIVDAGILMSQP